MQTGTGAAFAIVVALLLGVACGAERALAAEPPASDAPTANLQFGQPASIPMASRTISDWRPDGNKGIWIQSRRGPWFYGEFDAPCDELWAETSIGFVNGPTDELDKFGAILTRHAGKCKFRSFVTSAGPPPPPPKKKKSSPTDKSPATSAPVPESPPEAKNG